MTTAALRTRAPRPILGSSYGEAQATHRDLRLLVLLMGVVATLMAVATLLTSGVPAESYTTQLEQQRAEWLQEQEAKAPVQTAVVTAVAR